jgi:hypothetical protein
MLRFLQRSISSNTRHGAENTVLKTTKFLVQLQAAVPRNDTLAVYSPARYQSAAFQSSGVQALGQKPPTLARAAGKASSQ